MTLYFQVTELFFSSLLLFLISSSVEQTLEADHRLSAPIRPL